MKRGMHFFGVRVVFFLLLLGAFACGGTEARVQKYMKRADAYAANGEYAEAVIEYRNALQLNPNHAEAHLRLAKVFLKAQKVRDGYWELGEAVRLNPSRLDLRLEYGWLALEVQEYETAIEQAELVIQADSARPDGWLLKARGLHLTKQSTDAEAAYLKAIEAAPEQAKYYLAAALHYTEMKNLEQAERMVTMAVEKEPGFVSYVAMASFVSEMPARSKEGEAWWKKALESAEGASEESFLQGYVSLANYYFRQGNFADAEQTLRQASGRFPKNLDVIYLLARFYTSEGQAVKADELMESTVKILPDQVGPLLTLASYRHRKNDYEGAKKALEQALEIEPKGAAVRVRLADLYFEKGFATNDDALIKQGENIVDELLIENENEPEALYLRAKLDLADQKPVDALRRLRRAVELRPNWGQAHYVLGTTLTAQGDFNGARVALVRALELDGSLLGARKSLAQIYEQTGDERLLLEETQKILQVNPEDDEARILRAQTLLRQGKTKDAIRELGLIPEERRGVQAYYALGQSKFFLGEMDEARKHLLKAISLQPNSYEVLHALFRVDLATGRLADTAQRIQATVDANPDSADLWYLRGLVFGESKEMENAERAFRKVIKINPNFIDAYSELARLYMRAGETDRALRTFEEAAAATPNEPNLHLILGTLYEGLNQKAKARAAYETAIRLNPNLAPAKNNLAFMLADEGKELDRALTLAQEAKALVPNNPNIADTLGWVFYKKKVPAAAITYLKEAEQGLASDDPVLGSVQSHLALAYAANGEPEKAKALLRLALDNLDERRRIYRKKTGLEADVPAWATEAQKLLTKLGD